MTEKKEIEKPTMEKPSIEKLVKDIQDGKIELTEKGKRFSRLPKDKRDRAIQISASILDLGLSTKELPEKDKKLLRDVMKSAAKAMYPKAKKNKRKAE